MAYKSLINAPKEAFDNLIAGFAHINRLLDDLCFAGGQGAYTIGLGHKADFKANYLLYAIRAKSVLPIGLKQSSSFSFVFKLEDIEGYSCAEKEENNNISLDFKMYLKNNMRLTITRERWSEQSDIIITTKSASILYENRSASLPE